MGEDPALSFCAFLLNPPADNAALVA